MSFWAELWNEHKKTKMGQSFGLIDLLIGCDCTGGRRGAPSVSTFPFPPPPHKASNDVWPPPPPPLFISDTNERTSKLQTFDGCCDARQLLRSDRRRTWPSYGRGNYDVSAPLHAPVHVTYLRWSARSVLTRSVTFSPSGLTGGQATRIPFLCCHLSGIRECVYDLQIWKKEDGASLTT